MATETNSLDEIHSYLSMIQKQIPDVIQKAGMIEQVEYGADMLLGMLTGKGYPEVDESGHPEFHTSPSRNMSLVKLLSILTQFAISTSQRLNNPASGMSPVRREHEVDVKGVYEADQRQRHREESPRFRPQKPSSIGSHHSREDNFIRQSPNDDEGYYSLHRQGSGKEEHVLHSHSHKHGSQSPLSANSYTGGNVNREKNEERGQGYGQGIPFPRERFELPHPRNDESTNYQLRDGAPGSTNTPGVPSTNTRHDMRRSPTNTPVSSSFPESAQRAGDDPRSERIGGADRKERFEERNIQHERYSPHMDVPRSQSMSYERSHTQPGNTRYVNPHLAASLQQQQQPLHQEQQPLSLASTATPTGTLSPPQVGLLGNYDISHLPLRQQQQQQQQHFVLSPTSTITAPERGPPSSVGGGGGDMRHGEVSRTHPQYIGDSGYAFRGEPMAEPLTENSPRANYAAGYPVQTGSGLWGRMFEQSQGERRHAFELLAVTGIVTHKEFSENSSSISYKHIEDCLNIAKDMMLMNSNEYWSNHTQQANNYFQAQLHKIYSEEFEPEKRP